MAHSLGYTDIDNRGIAGIEKYFNSRLENDREPLKLSLDLRVQHKLRIALAESMSATVLPVRLALLWMSRMAR